MLFDSIPCDPIIAKMNDNAFGSLKLKYIYLTNRKQKLEV